MQPYGQLLGPRRFRVLLEQSQEGGDQEADLRGREVARTDVADYLDRFYSRTRGHSHIGGLSQSNLRSHRNDVNRVSTKSLELTRGSQIVVEASWMPRQRRGQTPAFMANTVEAPGVAPVRARACMKNVWRELEAPGHGAVTN